MTTAASLPKIRPVGHLERFSTSRHHLDFYNNVGTSAVYSSHTKLDIDGLKSLVYGAMAMVIAEHAVLSAVPVDEDKATTYFGRLPRVDLQEAVTFVPARNAIDTADSDHILEVDEVLEGQHNRDFKEKYGELPFWRLTILHRTDLGTAFVACFVFHHALADGTSGLAFHRSFHAALNSVRRESETLQRSGIDPASALANPVVTTSETGLLPPLEQLHPLPLSISYLLKEQWNEWFPKHLPTLWTGLPIPSSPGRPQARLHSLYFPQSTVQTLLSLSRTNRTTLSGTLETIIAASLFHHLPASHYDTLLVVCAVSLRRFLPPQTITPDSIGVYVSRDHHWHVRDGESSSLLDLFSWDAARAVRRSIETELDKKGTNTITGVLRWVSDIHGLFLKRLGKQREASFEFSNVGVFKPREREAQTEELRLGGVRQAVGLSNGDEKGWWEIGRVIFSQGADVVGAPFEASVVTGGCGGLNVSFSWLEGAVEADLMHKVVKSTAKLVEILTREESQT